MNASQSELERSERITMLTDFFLAAVAGALALPLLSGAHGGGQPQAIAWGMAFLFTAAAAVTGGVFHGARFRLMEANSARIWRSTLLLSAPVGFFIIAAGALGVASGNARALLLLIAAAKLVLVAGLLLRTGSFAVVAYDSGFSLLLLGILVGWALATGSGGRGGWWIVAGILLSLCGAIAQQRRFRGGRSFDHNDVFHLVQAGACYLFFQGAGQG